MTEMPWVIETRLAPGQKLRRNPVWGIVALVASLIGGLMFIIAMGAAFAGGGQLFVWMLPVWGIVALTAAAFTIAAFVRRGTLNVTFGAIAAAVLVLTNPVLALVIGLMLGVL